MIAIIDHRAPQDIMDGLFAHGFDILKMPAHPDLPRPVASHPDMLLFFAREHIFCTEKYTHIAQKELAYISTTTNKPIICVEEAISDQYPTDILLNAAVVGNTLICRKDHTAKMLIENTSYTVCNVRQGYAKCSTVPISNHALITSDPSIAKVARKIGKDVLEISSAHIEIEQYDSGFLGGATSYAPYTALRELYFCGDWKTHPNAKRIKSFCERYDRIPIALANRPLTDLGTVFLI